MAFTKRLYRLFLFLGLHFLLAMIVLLLVRQYLGEGETLLADFTGAVIVAAVLLLLVGLIRPKAFFFFLGPQASRGWLFIWLTLVTGAVITVMLVREGRLYALYGATFHPAARPEPQMVTVPDADGKSGAALAYPGEVVLIMKPGENLLTARGVIRQYGGQMIARLPALGVYLVGVTAGQEAEFITAAQKDARVGVAGPNLVIQGTDAEPVRLTKDGQDVRGLVALIGGAAAGQPVVMAQLDDFLGSRHGADVQKIGLSLAAGQNPLSVQVGQLPCGGGQPALCSSSDESLDGLAAVIAGAELNHQKVVINLSWGAPPPRTENSHKLTEGSASRENAWALAAYEDYFREVAALLDASSWASKGNVVLSLSAGNGALLVDEIKAKQDDEKVLANGRVDVGPAMVRLRQTYPEVLRKNLVVCGALEHGGQLADYTNFGEGVLYAAVPTGQRGTSFAAPQCWGASFNAWKEDSTRSSADVVTALYGSTAASKSGVPVLNPARAVAVFRKEVPPTVVEPAAGTAAPEAPGSSCNGQYFNPCPAGKKFYCPPVGGAAQCVPEEYRSCQGQWWAPCADSSTVWTCTDTGAECQPKDQPAAAPSSQSAPTPPTSPAPEPAPTPAPSPVPAPTAPQHYPCVGNAACNTYSAGHCGNAGALCATDGTCHCALPTQFGGWTRCPCSGGYTCFGNYCGTTAGGWPNE